LHLLGLPLTVAVFQEEVALDVEDVVADGTEEDACDTDV